MSNRHILDVGSIEAIQRRPARFADPRRLILEERLISRHFPSLPRQRFSFKSLQRLPAQPTELVVIPHVYEGPACARVLKIRITKIRTINGAIVFHCCWDMKVANLFAVRVADDISQAAVIHTLRSVLRIPHNFVDEVAEVQYETDSLRFGCTLILE